MKRQQHSEVSIMYQDRSSQRHNAHLPEIEIYYPFHPLRGKKFPVLGAARRLEEIHYLVALPDGTHTYLPFWMTQPQAGLISITKHPAVSLDALRRVKMILDATVQNLHDDRQSPHDGGEHGPNKTRSAVGFVRPDILCTNRDTHKDDAKDQKSLGRLNSQRVAIAQNRLERSTSASRRPR